jgi:two-component system, NtrC family, response regulator AtoC
MNRKKDKAPFTIFIVEDDEWYRRYIEHALSLDDRILTESFSNASDFIKRLPDRPDAVTLDYRLPDSTGGVLLKRIREFDEEIAVIIISEQEEIETAVELLKEGAYDYIVKNSDVRQKLLHTVNRLLERESLIAKIRTLQDEVEQRYAFGSTLIGKSKALLEVFGLMEKAVTNNLAVNIFGETGTGKELVAKAIHYNSVRKGKPLVALNMAAIPRELAESELFGHEKGAFTGAVTQRAGKFEEAHRGTLFLDEISEMELSLQGKLLRALQEKEVTRIGSNKTIPVDFRIIVATHRNLKEEVKAGRFREDLYYRLLGLSIQLPPLRERGDDILLLARHFADTFCNENNLQPKTFSKEAVNKMMTYNWPGNVRELRSVTELACVLSGPGMIDTEHINPGGLDNIPLISDSEMTMKMYNQKILSAYLDKYDNRIGLVADKLGISQATIYRMLRDMKQP